MDDVQDHGRITPDSLLNQIDFDLSQLELKRTRPGWSKWALVGALAYCIWLGLDLLENPAINLSASVRAAASLVVVSNGLMLLASLISPGKRSMGYARRFKFANKELAESRPMLVVMVSRSVGTLVITATLFEGLDLVSRIIVYVVLATEALFFFFILVMSYVPVPHPQRPKPKNRRAIVGLCAFAAAWAWAGGVLLLSTYNSDAGHVVQNWKLGLVLWVVASLMYTLVRHEPESALAPALIELRSRIVMCKSSVDEAMATYELIQAGMLADDVLQDSVVAVLDGLQRAESTLDDLRFPVESMDAALEDGRLTYEYGKEMVVAANEGLAVCETEMSRYGKASKNFDRICTLLITMDPSCEGEVKAVQARTQSHSLRIAERTRLRTKELRDRRERIVSRLDLIGSDEP